MLRRFFRRSCPTLTRSRFVRWAIWLDENDSRCTGLGPLRRPAFPGATGTDLWRLAPERNPTVVRIQMLASR